LAGKSPLNEGERPSKHRRLDAWGQGGASSGTPPVGGTGGNEGQRGSRIRTNWDARAFPQVRATLRRIQVPLRTLVETASREAVTSGNAGRGLPFAGCHRVPGDRATTNDLLGQYYWGPRGPIPGPTVRRVTSPVSHDRCGPRSGTPMSRPVGGNTTTMIVVPCDGSLSRQSGSALFTTYPTNGPIRSPRTAIRSPRDRGARRGSATCRPRLVPTVDPSTGRPLRSPCYLHGVGGAIVGDAPSLLAGCSRTPDSMAVATIHRSGRFRGARRSHRTNVTPVGR